MATIMDIATAIQVASNSQLTARQIRDATEDLISHEVLKPGRRGFGAESRSAEEMAAILLGAFGAPVPRHAGRTAKQIINLPCTYKSLIDPFEVDQHTRSAHNVTVFRSIFSEISPIAVVAQLIAKHNVWTSALDTIVRTINSHPRAGSPGDYRGSLLVLISPGEQPAVEVSARVYRNPTSNDLVFGNNSLTGFWIEAQFVGPSPNKISTIPETRQLDGKIIAALGAILAG